MTATVFLTTVGLVLGTILVIYGLRHVSAIAYAKLRVASDADHAALLGSIQEGLAEIKARLGAIEKILKDVE